MPLGASTRTGSMCRPAARPVDVDRGAVVRRIDIHCIARTRARIVTLSGETTAFPSTVLYVYRDSFTTHSWGAAAIATTTCAFCA